MAEIVVRGQAPEGSGSIEDRGRRGVSNLALDLRDTACTLRVSTPDRSLFQSGRCDFTLPGDCLLPSVTWVSSCPLVGSLSARDLARELLGLLSTGESGTKVTVLVPCTT